MAEVASAFVSVVPSARNFGSKLESEVGGSVKSAGKRVGLMFGRALAVSGVATGVALYSPAYADGLPTFLTEEAA